MNEIQKKQCHEIARHYGWDSQKNQTIQECAELIVELTARSDQENSFWIENLRGEIADCMIMLEQMVFMLDGGNCKVDAVIKNKIERQMRRIAAENAQEQACNDVDDKTHAKERNV